MIEKLKYLFAGSVMLAAAGMFVACDDDDDTAVDEWNATYVYMSRVALGVDEMSYKLSHSSLGVEGDTSFEVPVTINLSKPYTKDVEVVLGVSMPEGVPAEIASFTNGGRLVIPAGESSASDVLKIASDWSFVSEAETDYTFSLNIESVAQANDVLRISSHQRKLTIRVHKSKLTNVANEMPEGTAVSDKSAWEVRAGYYETTDLNYFSSPIPTLTNNNKSDYLYYGKQAMCIRVDLASEMTISGLESYCSFGSSYCMASCSIHASVDGENWELLTPEGGLSMASGYSQYVKFIVPVTARYLLWFMDAGSDRLVLCSEIDVYTK